MVADVSIIYEALDDQQLIVLQEDLDQDGLLNQDMPVVYTQNELVVNEGTYLDLSSFVKVLYNRF